MMFGIWIVPKVHSKVMKVISIDQATSVFFMIKSFMEDQDISVSITMVI